MCWFCWLCWGMRAQYREASFSGLWHGRDIAPRPQRGLSSWRWAGWSRDACPGDACEQGCPGMPPWHRWLSGDESSAFPGHGWSPATQCLSSSPRRCCLLRQPQAGVPVLLPPHLRGSERGWVPHTEAAVSLVAVFLPFVCVFLILSPRKRDQLQQ